MYAFVLVAIEYFQRYQVSLNVFYYYMLCKAGIGEQDEDK